MRPAGGEKPQKSATDCRTTASKVPKRIDSATDAKELCKMAQTGPKKPSQTSKKATNTLEKQAILGKKSDADGTRTRNHWIDSPVL